MTADRNIYQIASDVLKFTLSEESGAQPIAGVMARELAKLAAWAVDESNGACPACGAEPWVNIDCTVCKVATYLTRECSDCDNERVVVTGGGEQSYFTLCPACQPVRKVGNSCNLHDDCKAANERAQAQGRACADHCIDDCCEDCFGN